MLWIIKLMNNYSKFIIAIFVTLLVKKSFGAIQGNAAKIGKHVIRSTRKMQLFYNFLFITNEDNNIFLPATGRPLCGLVTALRDK